MTKKKSDSGAATNLRNFDTIITYVKAIGPKYDPSNEDLTVKNLQKIADEGVNTQKEYSAATAKYRPAIETKQDTFALVAKLFPRILNALKNSKVSSGTTERVKMLVAKYRGDVKVAKEEDKEATSGETDGSTEEPKKERSNRQTSYAFLIQHFEGIYQILANEPKYAPKNNETIKLTALAANLELMRSTMKLSDETEAALFRVRNLQTKLHNDPEKGICALAALVKAYLIEDFGNKSIEYKAISSLTFKKIYDSTANKKKKKATAEEEEEGEKKKKKKAAAEEKGEKKKKD